MSTLTNLADQSLDVSGTKHQTDQLDVSNESKLLGMAVAGQSGSLLSITGTAPFLTISGLSGITQQSLNRFLTISGASSLLNNGTFLITEVISPTSVKIKNQSGTPGDANNGSIQWTERRPFYAEDDHNYHRSDRAAIKGVPYDQSIPTFIDPETKAVIPANLSNLSGSIEYIDGYISLISGGLVSSVFGRTGNIVSIFGDYNSNQITNISTVSGVSVSDALNNLKSLIISGGGGTVSGPPVSVDNAIVRWDGADGYNIQSSGIVIDDLNNVTGVSSVNGVVIEDHSSRHEFGGADQIDGYDIYVNYAPANYSIINNILGEHIAAIDAALASSGSVISVFGRVGLVTAQASDYNASQIDNDSNVPGAFVSNALNYLDNKISLIYLDGYALDSDLQNHILDTNNPHNTSIANIGSGTLAQLNSAITDATIDDSSNPRTPTAHAITHEAGGSDEIEISNLYTSEVNSSLVLKPNGTGGVYWTSENVTSLDGYVYNTTQVVAGAGLSGGGSLSTDVTLNISNADGSIIVNPNDIQVGVLATDIQHGSRGGGNLHALASSVLSGFLSSDGYTKLDSVEFGAQVNTVDSVFGRTGAVVAVSGDYNSDQITNSSMISGASVSDALETLSGMIIGGGSGTVYGPPTTTDNALVRWNGTDGYNIQNSGIIVSDTDVVTGVTSINGVVVESHASRHENGGADEIEISNLGTSETNTSLVLKPNGTGGVVWGVDSTVSLDGYVYETRQIIAGAGLTGGGDLSVDRTIDVVANIDGSIVVNANDIQVGVLATDTQHGNRGGGTLHSVATASVAGFMSATDKSNLDNHLADTNNPHSTTLAQVLTAGNTTGLSNIVMSSGTQITGAAPNPVVTIQGIKNYPLSGVDPVLPAPANGDRYYNSSLSEEMIYDGARAKWLSIATSSVFAGRNGNTTAGQYYRGMDGLIYDAVNSGMPVEKGTITYIAITRGNAGSAILDVLVNGAVVTTLGSTVAGVTLNAAANVDFNSGIMSFRNQAGSVTTTNVQIVIKYKRRV